MTFTSDLTLFFNASLSAQDPEVAQIITRELWRQQEHVELIASENIVSQAVIEAMGSILTNKYAEGYPGKRYYHGCEHVDEMEQLAIDRAKRLFGASFVNVQPHSGSQANQAVYLALLKPNDLILGMSLDAGGHLTHGASVSASGKYYRSLSYGVNADTGLIDYDQVETLAIKEKPQLIIAGGSAYPRTIDFQRFRSIADKVGAMLMVDMAHVAGLVAGGVYPNPLLYADVVTTTTHKTLRGPRGGMILTNNPDIAKKVNSAVFPGLQGGPLMHIIAGKAVALGEALSPAFRAYAAQVIHNAQALADTLGKRGLTLVSGGTDTHLLLLDLRPIKQTGSVAADALARANIICNKNAVPNDPEKPSITSGLRLGTPAGTTRGFSETEFHQIGSMIADILESLPLNSEKQTLIEQEIRQQSLELCRRFPIYS